MTTKDRSPAELAAEEILAPCCPFDDAVFTKHGAKVLMLRMVRWLAAELKKKAVSINKIGDDGYPREELYVPLSVVKELVGEE